MTTTPIARGTHFDMGRILAAYTQALLAPPPMASGETTILARSEDGHAGGSMETGVGCDGGAPDRVTVSMCGERAAIMLLVSRLCVRCQVLGRGLGARVDPAAKQGDLHVR